MDKEEEKGEDARVVYAIERKERQYGKEFMLYADEVIGIKDRDK